MSSYAARTREMFRKYGKVAVGVHFAVYFTGLGGKERKEKREKRSKVEKKKCSLRILSVLFFFYSRPKNKPLS